MLALIARSALIQPTRFATRRALSTLEGNPHIYVFPNHKALSGYILTLLPTDPPTSEIALGASSVIPPTPDSLQENSKFSNILQAVIAEHAHNDPELIAQAHAMASSGGGTLGLIHRAKQSGASGGGASDQGGMGSGGRGGWVHVSDQRNIPDYGRIAWPEDIFGSLEVDGKGNFVDGTGRYQSSGTYRMVTRDGILGLSQYLREKLVQRLKAEEASIRN